MKHSLLIMLFICMGLSSFILDIKPVNTIVKAFEQIKAEAQVIEYTNALEVNHQGGHIQGVQWMRHEDNDYVFMSGSSSTYAYYSVVKIGDQTEVISVNKILDKPYKHAGGFQIYDDYMAVGIEDNEARNTSKVYLYRIDDPEQPPQQPMAVIERNGAYERATAGCVGIVKLDERILVVVGDWGSQHLDFYISDEQLGSFGKIYTITAAEVEKEDWVNQQWLSYQNINLIKDKENNLFLIGLARNEDEQDIGDLFRLETKDFKAFEIQKIASKKFEAKKGTSFKWGAGVMYDEHTASMKIISCTAHMKEASVLNEFK